MVASVPLKVCATINTSGWQIFSANSHISGFVSYMIFLTGTQLCHKQYIIDGRGCILIKLQKQAADWIWPTGHSLLNLDLYRQSCNGGNSYFLFVAMKTSAAMELYNAYTFVWSK